MDRALHSVDNPSFLTFENFSRALEAVADGPSEDACAGALVVAADMVQEAVLADQPGEEMLAVLEQCGIQHHAAQAAVLNRAADFHRLDDGGTLALWLLPVSLGAPASLPETISLAADGNHAMRMSGALLSQLGLSADLTKRSSAETPVGWTYLLPALYAIDCMANADLGELIRLPREALAVVHGARRRVSFQYAEDVKSDNAGRGQVYVLPFVAYHPPGATINLPDASEKMVERMTRWIRASVEVEGDESLLSVRVLSQPQPYSTALTVATRLRREEVVRDALSQMMERAGVQANALAALVASYNIVKSLANGTPAEDEQGVLKLGVSLVSRLTGSVVGTATLTVDSDDGVEEVALTTYLLNQLGVTCTEHRSAPITSIACQHCGGVQLAYPSAQAAQRGVHAPSQSIQ
jgi:hypothetical protein